MCGLMFLKMDALEWVIFVPKYSYAIFLHEINKKI